MVTITYQPVILIGAARSGTKLLRDLIARHPAVDKVPYDVNYIWRLGNQGIPHDELSPELLNSNIKYRIIKSFKRYSVGAPILLEKTVSNSLRVPYVSAIFPTALFLHLVRDGRDVVESTYRQWVASPNWRYIFEKAKTFPLKEAFGYAFSYAGNVFRKLIAYDHSKVSTWGPRYRGIDEDVAKKDLLEVCAIQWACCAKKAVYDLDRLSSDRILTIRYEDFVIKPCHYLEKIALFLGISPAPYFDLNLDVVTPENIGKGNRNLSRQQMARILLYIDEPLSFFGYKQVK